jgi:hypothetical protein
MEHFTKQKAYYQLTQFIADGKHKELGLTAYDITILFMIVRYLDMPQGFCSLTQENFAKECCMSVAEFKRRTEFLAKIKIIFRYFKKRTYQYELGESITGIPQF